MSTTLRDADEHPHSAPEPLPDRWQENYFVLGFDDDQRAAFALHLERFPASGLAEIKADVALGETVVSSTSRHPLTEDLSAGATTIDVVEPFREWRLRHDGTGRAGRGPFGFVGHGDGPIGALGIDVTLSSPLGGIDHAAVLAELAMPGTEREHYETCGTWTGRLRAGEHEVTARGLFVRDHTWGPRAYSQLSGAWWYPSCLEAGARYLGGALVRYGDHVSGYAIVADADGHEATTEVALEIVAGIEAPVRYDTTVVTARFATRGELRVKGSSRLHLPHYFPGFADRYFTNDAFCALACGADLGFGVRELNGYLGAAEATTLDAVAH